jgi:sensor histidine kinase regulating citrate/malate metabolism
MNKNKLIIGAIVLIILVALGAYYASTSQQREMQKEEINVLDQATGADTTESIDESLKNIDIESGTDEDINSIDKELKVL